MVKTLIWQNIDLNLDDYIDEIKDCYGDVSEDMAYDIMYNWCDEELEMERDFWCEMFVNNELASGDIIAIGDIGRWNGRFTGYKMVDYSNIFIQDYDYMKIYLDEHDDLMKVGHHHDGTNYITYRALMPGITEEEFEELVDNLDNWDIICKYTTNIFGRIEEEFVNC